MEEGVGVVVLSLGGVIESEDTIGAGDSWVVDSGSTNHYMGI